MNIFVNPKINTKLFQDKKNIATHQMALQAERDTRPYLPRATGNLQNRTIVIGNKITYNTPYAIKLYFGYLSVDPTRKINGFKTPDGWKSFKGVRKQLTTKKMVYNSGGSNWFTKSAKVNKDRWAKIAAKELLKDGNRIT